jgi:hypothetical protein
MKTDKVYWYMGEMISPAGRNTSGLRWQAHIGSGFVYGETLACIKQLIKEAKTGKLRGASEHLNTARDTERDYERRAAFGEGVNVVNVLTGQRFRT